MYDDVNQGEKRPSVATGQQLGLKTKLLLTVVVLGAVAAGVYLAVALSK